MALGLSAALLIPGYFLLAPKLHPEFNPARAHTDTKPIDLEGSLFRPVIAGESEQEGSSTIIRELAAAEPDDHAVLVHRRLFQASRYPFLRYHIEGRNPALSVIVFWQRLDAPGENFFLELDYSGEGPTMHNMLRSEEWKGTITELAVGFFGDLRGEVVKLHGVGLEPYSNLGLLEVVRGEWTAFEPWNQSSINRYDGRPAGALLPFNGLVLAWLVVALLLGWIAVRIWPSLEARGWQFLPPANLVFSFGIAWLLLTGLWANKLWQQNHETRHLFAGKGMHERHLADWDSELYALAQQVKEAMPENADKLIILYTHGKLRAPNAARLRYHLLPEKRVEHTRPITRGWVKRATRDYDHILIVSDPLIDMPAPLALLEAQQYRATGKEVVLLRHPKGALLALNKRPDEKAH